jgi:hypothetical protein
MPRIRLLVWLIMLGVAATTIGPAHAQVGYLTGSAGKGAVKVQQRTASGQAQGQCGMKMNTMMGSGMNPLGGGMNSMVAGMNPTGGGMNSMVAGMNPMGTGGFAGSFTSGNGLGSGTSASSFAAPFANGYSQTPNYQEMMMMQQQMVYQMMLMQQYYIMQMMQNQYNAGLTQSPYQTALLGRQTPTSNQTTQTTAYRQAAALRR